MVSKQSELVKKQARYRYGRFASPTSRTTPTSRQEVESSSHLSTAHAPSHQEEASFDDSIVEMWEVSPPPTSRQEVSADYWGSAFASKSGVPQAIPTSQTLSQLCQRTMQWKHHCVLQEGEGI
jgi:hypothetical protein